MPTPERIRKLQNAFQSESLTGVLSIKLLNLEPGKAVMEMPVQRWFIVSENRCVQGGITAALADWAAVFAAMSSIEQGHAYLAEIEHMKFTDTIKEGEIMIGHAKISQIVGREIWVDISVFSAVGKLKATGKFLFKKPKTP